MGRKYSVEFAAVAVTAAQDFFEITPADDKPCKPLALFLSQSTEVGDAAEEMLDFKVIRGHATSGSGGTVSTPAPLDPDDAAAGFTCEVNNTTIASTGTPIDIHSDSFNVRTGLQLIFTPEMQAKVKQGQTTLVVRLISTPADSVTMSGTLYVEEL